MIKTILIVAMWIGIAGVFFGTIIYALRATWKLRTICKHPALACPYQHVEDINRSIGAFHCCEHDADCELGGEPCADWYKAFAEHAFRKFNNPPQRYEGYCDGGPWSDRRVEARKPYFFVSDSALRTPYLPPSSATRESIHLCGRYEFNPADHAWTWKGWQK